MKESIKLSINPTYYCNFRCQFCYLSSEQLSSSKKIDLDIFSQRLSEISQLKKIDHVDLYGGEIALLPQKYLNDFLSVIHVFYKKKISVITNGSIINSRLLESDIDLSVSWDYLAREKHEFVYQNMMNLQRPFHLLLLASRKVLNFTQQEIFDLVEKLNSLPNLISFEVKPYSDNHHHRQSVDYKEYEEFVKKLFSLKEKFSFEFINETKIKESLNQVYSSWSDDHLYLTPEGDWAVLDFDELNREYFKKIKDLQEYEVWANEEKEKVLSSPACSRCDHLGHCLSEHLQYVSSEAASCNGFRGLLDWYKKNELQRHSTLV